MKSENKWLGAGIVTPFVAALETEVSYANRSVAIAYDKTRTNRESLVQAINSTGFKVAE